MCWLCWLFCENWQNVDYWPCQNVENDASMGKFLCIFHMVSQLHKIHWRDAWTAHFLGWLGSLVVKALDLQLAGCEFNSRPRRCRVTTLGKLFTPTCLSRSQWFSDGMIDCGMRGCGQLCLSWQPLRCRALGTGCAPFLQCLGRLSLPPCGMVKWVSAFRLSNNNKWRWWIWMVAAIYRRTHSPSRLAWSEGCWPLGAQSAFVKWTGWTLAVTMVMRTTP